MNPFEPKNDNVRKVVYEREILKLIFRQNKRWKVTNQWKTSNLEIEKIVL